MHFAWIFRDTVFEPKSEARRHAVAEEQLYSLMDERDTIKQCGHTSQLVRNQRMT